MRYLRDLSEYAARAGFVDAAAAVDKRGCFVLCGPAVRGRVMGRTRSEAVAEIDDLALSWRLRPQITPAMLHEATETCRWATAGANVPSHKLTRARAIALVGIGDRLPADEIIDVAVSGGGRIVTYSLRFRCIRCLHESYWEITVESGTWRYRKRGADFWKPGGSDYMSTHGMTGKAHTGEWCCESNL